MKVYVFTAEQVFDYEVSDLIVDVYANKEDAESRLKMFADEALEYVEKRGWVVEHNTSDLYRAYDDGRYPENHVEFSVWEEEVK